MTVERNWRIIFWSSDSVLSNLLYTINVFSFMTGTSVDNSNENPQNIYIAILNIPHFSRVCSISLVLGVLIWHATSEIAYILAKPWKLSSVCVVPLQTFHYIGKHSSAARLQNNGFNLIFGIFTTVRVRIVQNVTIIRKDNLKQTHIRMYIIYQWHVSKNSV